MAVRHSVDLWNMDGKFVLLVQRCTRVFVDSGCVASDLARIWQQNFAVRS